MSAVGARDVRLARGSRSDRRARTAPLDRPEMWGPLREGGVILFAAYCLFNVANVLYLRSNLPLIGLALAGMGGLYLLQRLALLRSRGWVSTRSEIFGYLLMLLVFMVVLLQQSLLTDYTDYNGVRTLQVIHSATTVAIVWMLIGGAVSMSRMRESFLLSSSCLRARCSRCSSATRRTASR